MIVTFRDSVAFLKLNTILKQFHIPQTISLLGYLATICGYRQSEVPGRVRAQR